MAARTRTYFVMLMMCVTLLGASLTNVHAKPSVVIKPGSLGSVYFVAGSAKLDVSAKRTLNVWAGRLKYASKVDVIGYVHPTKNVANNKTLSLARAKSVVTYLKALGVKALFTPKGASVPKNNGNARSARRAEVLVTQLIGSQPTPSPTIKPTASPKPTPSTSITPSPTASPTATPSPTLIISAKPSVVIAAQKYVLSGRLTPAPSPTQVRIEQLVGSTWTPLGGTTTNKVGRWSIALSAPPTYGLLTLRAATGARTSGTIEIRVASLPSIKVAGPGARILGADISRYQHSSLPIDFKAMATSGVAFLFIKASDGSSSEDKLARPLAAADAQAAKSAGIYVGYYHVARLPRSNTASVVRASARNQARLALARLAELGGYDGSTLPYVLDIELAPKGITDTSITLWTKTWLDVMYEATSRRPIIYSYRAYFSGRYLQDNATRAYLRQFPMWLAHPGNPANPKIIPGKSDTGRGCFNTAWTLKDCTASWSFWQYTASGDRELYGIPWSPKAGTKCTTGTKYCSEFVHQTRRHLDLNVFNGSITDLVSLALGTWQQVPVPTQTPTPSPNPTPSS